MSILETETYDNNIGYNDRCIIKEELLTDVELIDRYQKKGDIDLLYCRLLTDNFGFQKDSYVIIEFKDDDDLEDYGINYGVNDNYFKVVYAKNKDFADDLWKHSIDKGLDDFLELIHKNRINYYSIKTKDQEIKEFYFSNYSVKNIIMKKELKINRYIRY
jgi:hypothetical protein